MIAPVTRLLPADDGAYSALRRSNEAMLAHAAVALECAAVALCDAGDLAAARDAWRDAALMYERSVGLNAPEAVHCRARAARAHELT